jgi:hypothetical protein
MPEIKKKKIWERRVSTVIIYIISLIVGMLANLSLYGLKESKPLYYAVTIVFAALLVMMTTLVYRFKRGPTKVVTLKDSVINAFCGAIESSPLNPKTTEGRSND